MFNSKEIADLQKKMADLKERLVELESSVVIYPQKDYRHPSKELPINQVVRAIVNHLGLDIVATKPTYRDVELKPKQVPPISTGEMK